MSDPRVEIASRLHLREKLFPQPQKPRLRKHPPVVTVCIGVPSNRFHCGNRVWQFRSDPTGARRPWLGRIHRCHRCAADLWHQQRENAYRVAVHEAYRMRAMGRPVRVAESRQTGAG